MSTATGKELLLKLRQRFKIEFPSDAAETLERVHKSLSDNMVVTQQDATHQVIGDYSDWWDSQSTTRGPKLLAVSEDYHVEELYVCISKMHELKAPLTLGEKRTAEFKLFQELEIRGNKLDEKSMDPELLVGPTSKFLELIGTVMVELYPWMETLHLFVLDGSGKNLHVGVPETFIRLVWPNIIVDKTRAFGIMDTLLKTLQNTDCDDVKALERKAKNLSEANSWKSCLKDKIYHKADPIRMIFNDSVSDPPLSKIEGRPIKPLYIYEFKNKNGILESFECIKDFPDISCFDFCRLTSIRQNGGTELTPWVAPKGLVPRPAINGESAPNGFAASRGAGHVHVRTAFGSPGDKNPKGPRHTIEERTTMAERLFVEGSLKDFVEKMKTALGEDTGVFQTNESEKKVTWTHHKSGTKVEFREANRKVAVTGKDGSVRQIIAVAEKFLDAVPEGYTGAETSSRAFTRSGYAGSKAPTKGILETAASLAGRRTHASSVAVLSQANKPKTTSGPNGTKKVPYKRKVVEDFEEEGDESELGLLKGQVVTVTEDPDAKEGDLDRWVYGSNESSGKDGWFPLRYTGDLD